MYINTQTLDYPLTLRQVRQAVPNVSLPKEPDEKTLSALGFATVQPTERPAGDVVTEGSPQKQADGTWQQTWNTRPFTADELEQQRLASIPDSVPALDALLALDAAGLSDAYEAWANDPARTFAERAFITKAQNWRRDDPTLQNAGTALGLTNEQIDQLFIDAAKL